LSSADVAPRSQLSRRRIIKASSSFFNLEIGLIGFVSASLLLLINVWGTGYIAWHAAFIRLGLSIGYHLFVTKMAEHLTRFSRSHLGQLFWANLFPNTVYNAIQYPIFVALGVPRPFWSVFPFWCISLITFTQIVKYARKGYEPGVLDIAIGLWYDLARLFGSKKAERFS